MQVQAARLLRRFVHFTAEGGWGLPLEAVGGLDLLVQPVQVGEELHEVAAQNPQGLAVLAQAQLEVLLAQLAQKHFRVPTCTSHSGTAHHGC